MSAHASSSVTLPQRQHAGWLRLAAALLILLSVLLTFPAVQLTVATARVAGREFRATVFEGGAAATDHEGVSPWLDTSMVTPLLLDFTLLCMGLGAVCLGGWTSLTERWIGKPTFPFPKGYRGFFVQYGLLGTVYGLILAFWNLNLSQEVSSQTRQLLTGMGAALWSTLTALVLAYVVCPLIERLYQGLARVGGHAVVTSPGKVLSDFARRVTAATGAIGDLEMEARRLAVDLALAPRIASLEAAAAELRARDKAVTSQLSQVERRLSELQSSMEKQGQSATAALTTSEALEKRVREAEESIQAIKKALKALGGALSTAIGGR